MHHGVLLRGVHPYAVIAHHASVRRHLLLLFVARYWMAALDGVEILDRLSRKVRSVCRLRGRKLFIFKDHAVGDGGVVGGPLCHLDCDVAGVRAEQRVRLLALLDFLLLETETSGVRTSIRR